MKKSILLFVFLSLVISGNVKANPIMPPPVSVELYFDASNKWFIELYFEGYGTTVSDSLVLMTSTDTVSFKPGFHIPNTPFIMTVDSLKSPLTINKNGDLIAVGQRNDGTIFNLDWCPFAFGNIANAQVSAPILGQSIKRLQCNTYTGDPAYFLVKDDKIALGTPFVVSDDSSSFSGHVFDSNHNPVPGALVSGNIELFCPNPYNPTSLTTDVNGYYSSSSIYSYIRNITIQKQFCNSIDTTFSIEPNSATVIDFTLDSCTVGLIDFSKPDNYSMQVFPNPGSENFTFHVTTTDLKHENCLIRIYNSTGELVNIIPVNNMHDSTASISWNGKGKYDNLSAGMYTCALVINGKTITSEKLIIEK